MLGSTPLGSHCRIYGITWNNSSTENSRAGRSLCSARAEQTGRVDISCAQRNVPNTNASLLVFACQLSIAVCRKGSIWFSCSVACAGPDFRRPSSLWPRSSVRLVLARGTYQPRCVNEVLYSNLDRTQCVTRTDARLAGATATAGNLRQREKRDESGFLHLPTRVPVRPSTTSFTSGCSSASEFKHPLPPSARQSRRHAAASVRYLPRGGGQHIGAAGSFPPQPPRGESCMLSVRQRHLEQDRHSPRDDPAAKAAELAQRLAASNEWVKRQAFNSTGELLCTFELVSSLSSVSCLRGSAPERENVDLGSGGGC